MKKLIVIITIFFINLYINPQKINFSLEKEKLDALYSKVDNEFKSRYNANNLALQTSGPDFAAFLLNAVFVNYPKDRIEKCLLLLKKFQNTNIAADRYLNFYWYWGDKEVRDPNAVEFINRQLLLLWILYKDDLTENSKKTLSQILILSNAGVKSHPVKLSYTNIILMKTWNLIAFGESFNDKKSKNEGYKLFFEWIKYVSQFGITEYLSPTYCAVDLENLGLIFNFTQNKDIKNKAEKMLDYFWTDISANRYEPSFRLGGTHSRDYDRLYGRGQLDAFFIKAEFTEELSKKKYSTPYDFYSFYKPPEDLKKLITLYPRFIIQRWGENDYNYAFNYISKNFSIASSLSNYHNMDKTPLVINLGSGIDTPQINFFMDERSDYYGFKKTEERSGHLKSLHLIPFISSVQNKNEVIFTASVNGSGKENTALESIITLPALAEYYLGDKKIDIFKHKPKWIQNPLPNNSTTFINCIKINNELLLKIKDLDPKAGVGISQKHPAVPGSDYETKINFKGKTINLYINWYDKEGNRIGDEKIKPVSGKDNIFMEFSQIEKAPLNASTVKVWIYSTIGSTTEIFIKDLSFKKIKGNIILAGFDFEENQTDIISIPVGKNLIIYRENTACVLRTILSLDTENKPINPYLYNDGLAYNALRLTAVHSKTPTTQKGTFALWAYVEDEITTTAKLNEFIDKIKTIKSSYELKNNVLTLTVKGINKEYKLVSDIEKHERIYTSSNKEEYSNILLSVNNNDMGKKLMEKIYEKK